ncbi:hypothetical protein [Streptomyces sp. NPDC005125]
MINREKTTISHTAPYKGLTGVYAIDLGRSTIGFPVRDSMVTNVCGKFAAFEGLRNWSAGPGRSCLDQQMSVGSSAAWLRERNAPAALPGHPLGFRDCRPGGAGLPTRQMTPWGHGGHIHPVSAAEGHTMNRSTENQIDIAATVMSLATEATELQARVNELRQELVDLNERMRAIYNALYQLAPVQQP